MMRIEKHDGELFEYLYERGYINAAGILGDDLTEDQMMIALAIVAFYDDLKMTRLEKARERYEAHIAKRLLFEAFGEDYQEPF